MKFLIYFFFIAIFIDIPLNNLLICILTYSIYIISACPKVTAPKLAFDFRMRSKKFLCRDAFHSLNYFFYRYHWFTLDQKMNMVIICSYFNIKYFISAFNIFKTSTKLLSTTSDKTLLGYFIGQTK